MVVADPELGLRGAGSKEGVFVLLALPAFLPSVISSFFTQESKKGGGGGGGVGWGTSLP